MNRQDKAQCIDRLKEDFANSGATFLVNYRGLTVAEMNDLRAQLRNVHARMQVVKGRLAKRAAGTVDQASVLDPYLHNQIALIFSDVQSVPETAKVVADFSKQSEALELSVGVMDAALLSAADVKRLASLPSKEVLLSQLAGTMQAPIAGVARAMNMVVLKLAWALVELQKKKEQEA